MIILCQINEQNKINFQLIETALLVYALDNDNAENLTEVEKVEYSKYAYEYLACKYWYVKKSSITLV